MKPLIAHTKADLQTHVRNWKAAGQRIGFVPTMGALHEGHLSLVRLALERAERCVVSIFVNPAQFAPHEDFDQYPRQKEADLALLTREGAHIAYLPAVEDIYPEGPAAALKAGKEAEGLEGACRLHFFDGVVTVVERLFRHVTPDIAVFGEKDFQQLKVIEEMVTTQNLPVEIIGGPVIRDEAGLALSSRNAYLDAKELAIARTLNRVLRESVRTGDLEAAEQQLLENGFIKVDYVAKRWNRVLAAAWVGKTRLIDNVGFNCI